MAKTVQRLNALRVDRVTTPGMHADGEGLYLQVSKTGAKSWIYRYMIDGRTHDMGLGPVRDISLSFARELAAGCRKQKLAGFDPKVVRDQKIAEARLAEASTKTFAECAKEYIASQKAGWKSAKHACQWQSTIDTYASPVIGDLPISAVETTDVMRVLDPIWRTKTETASRLRMRIEKVLDWAATSGYRTGDNPARWRGHLEHSLPKRSKVRTVKHHPALPYDQIGPFMTELRDQNGIGAMALEFAILTATRTSETIGARWSEIDLEGGVWTIPPERIKAGKEHRVPLSAPAIRLLVRMKEVQQGEFVFPGKKAKSPLSNMALLSVLERMGRSDITVHGFRSTFRDWAAECTDFHPDVAEMALAHAIENKTEAAYRRGDLFMKRRLLMEEWANHCSVERMTGEVVRLRSTG